MKLEKLKSKFKCRKLVFYGPSCKRCKELNGTCDYSQVIDFRPLAKRNRCPICDYKGNMSKCELCKEFKVKI